MSKHTPGPWAWMQRGYGYIDLATPHSGRLIVMDFVRHGMQRAQPRFAVTGDDQPRGRRGGLLCTASELIAQHPAALLDHPDATLIAAAPDLLEALTAVLDAHSANTLFNNAGHWEAARAAIAKATQP